jgi:[ribosomal protein S5]-alanine N-acetyltransferase
MKIFSEGIVLRPWYIDDAEQLALIANNKNIAGNLRDGFPYPYSLNDAKNWLNIILKENFPPKLFAITIDKSIVGSIGIVVKTDIYRRNFEIGYFVAEEHWGKGIATKAIRSVTSYAFREFDIVRVYAEPFSDNTGSKRALEKAGFALEATFKRNVIKNGIIKDSCIYSVLKEDFKYFVPSYGSGMEIN